MQFLISSLMSKLEKLKKILKGMRSALLAYSGGVDSAFLLKVSRDTLGDKVLAVTAVSATYPREELESARETALRLKAKHKIIRTLELKQPNFVSNPVNRCYFCKKELFGKLKKIACDNDLNFVIDASNVTDKKDFRPGDRAKKESGVRSPLQEAGFTKNEIRRLSRELRLATWDKPSLACLASRIPYGSRITPAVLSRIEKAESLIKALGFKQVRLRHYGELCRIEVEPDKAGQLVKKRSLIVAQLKKLGYNYVTVDLEGYRVGSLNEAIKR
ncbi:MAG: ATP-dependent sacrificial sulfur transferase LarE [Candidatus Omnitrophota bacterium]